MEELTVEEILEHFHTNTKGLSSEEAEKRLKIYGLNTLEKHGNVLFELFLRSVFSPVNLMILFAAIVSYFAHKIDEFFIILFLLLLNIFIVFVQEFKSEKELETLKEKLQTKVKVLRDGKLTEVSSEYIVPGDVIILEAEDVVPADAKIIDCENLIVDESAVTGESLPREKKKGDILYASSIIRTGSAICVVVATGVHTTYGKIINIVQKEKVRNNLEYTILKIGTALMIGACILIAITFIYGYFILKWSISKLIVTSLAILVSFIPTAMPAVISTILIYSSVKLARENILVRRLSSIFDLAQMNMLCTDKTGTITKNQIVLKEIIPVTNIDEKEVLRYALLASDPSGKDPIDRAVIKKAKELGIEREDSIIKRFFPYDSKRKYSYSIIKEGDLEIEVKKGSPAVLTNEEKYKEVLDKLYSKGYRVLAVCKESCVIGFLAFYDPPRDDAKEFISELKNLGINVKMVTGDVLETAVTIGNGVGIAGEGIRKKDLYKVLTDQHVRYLINRYSIFAEVFPDDKYKIVKTLKDLGYTVGVTGDGVNDIGALKVANVGIAVYNATNAAKSFADLILTSPGLKQLVEAIKSSREALKRIENYIVYRISENINFPVLVTVLLLIYNKLFLSPIHMLLLTLLNDIPIFTIAVDRVTFYKKPSNLNLKKIILISFVLSLVSITRSFIFAQVLLSRHLNIIIIQTLMFLQLVIGGHFLLFVIHSRDKFWFEDLPARPLLIATITTELIGTLVAIELLIMLGAPIVAFYMVLFTWVYVFIWMQMQDLIKVVLFRKIWKSE